MRLIRACVIAGAASLLIGVPAASAAPTLTIKPKNRAILYGGKATKIVGHLGGTSPNSGQKIRRQSKSYPYTADFKNGPAKNTEASGNYAFTANPDRNTRYRAVLVSDPATAS